MQPTETRPPRSRWIIAFGILAVLIGLFGVAGGVGLLLNADSVFALFDALLAVIIGLLYIAAGVGFFPGKAWAWVLGVSVSSVSLIDSVVEHPAVHAYGIPGAIVAAVMIFYLSRPSVKAFFGKRAKQTVS